MTIIKVISFNIWFSSYEFRQRNLMIKNLLKIHNPDVIIFQEVIQNSLSFYQKEFAEYYFSKIPSGDRDYFEVIFSRYPLSNQKIIPLMSDMDRQLKIVDLEDLGLSIATTHLESLESSSVIRLRQFQDCFEYLDKYDDIIFAGDFNLIGNDKYRIRLPEDWYDVWEQVDYSDKWRFTFDYEQNNYVSKPFQERLDRVYFKSTSSHLLPIGFKLIGKSEEGKIFPSDHFGILTQFDISK